MLRKLSEKIPLTPGVAVAMKFCVGAVLGLSVCVTANSVSSSFCDDDGDWKLVWADEFDGSEVKMMSN